VVIIDAGYVFEIWQNSALAKERLLQGA